MSSMQVGLIMVIGIAWIRGCPCRWLDVTLDSAYVLVDVVDRDGIMYASGPPCVHVARNMRVGVDGEIETFG